MTSCDVAIVGSGVIGLSTAWQLAATGIKVTLVDPAPGRGASSVAAGMLAPVTEAAWGEEELIEINLRSASSWPDYARQLEVMSGLSVGYRSAGTILIAANRGDRSYLEELLEFQHQLGLDSSWRQPTQCREIEPLLSPGLNGGIVAPQDHQVDNRRLLAALDEACRRLGVITDRRRVSSIAITNGCVDGVVIDEYLLRTNVVVVAAGVGTNTITGLPSTSIPPVRPVKGQIFRLRTNDGVSFLDHCVRGLVNGNSVYVVPRKDGRVVVGATVEEQGNDTTVTAGAVYELLRDAIRVLPGLSELEVSEIQSGLRPGSPDNAPIVGPSEISGLVYATGHYRNGILLSPATAQALVALIRDGELPSWATPFSPERFTQNAQSDLSAKRIRELI